MRSLDGHDLKIRQLEAILFRSTEFPGPRVSVPNVLGRIAFLTADLTDFRHDRFFRLKWEPEFYPIRRGPSAFLPPGFLKIRTACLLRGRLW